MTRPPWWRPFARRRWDRAQCSSKSGMQIGVAAPNALLNDIIAPLRPAAGWIVDVFGNEMRCETWWTGTKVTIRSPRHVHIGRVEFRDATGAWLVRVSPPDVPYAVAAGEDVPIQLGLGLT